MIKIREAVLDDVPAIVRVHVQADWDTYSALFGSQAYALEPGESELRWRRAIGDGDILLVASDGIEIVGLGHARGDRIGALYLLRSHQRRGIGKALLTHLLASLKELSVAEARFDVVAINDNAIAFYRAHGAYPVGRSVNRAARGDTEDLVFAISTDPVAPLRRRPARGFASLVSRLLAHFRRSPLSKRRLHSESRRHPKTFG
jgi:ribosomal protein S18 acetylase RimI-like enzyme